jgi:DNA-binding transcriptional LysR family regulator
MTMAVPDLVALRMLVAIRDSRSITAASRLLGLSQQAVSARMRALEGRLGLVLFLRSHRGSDLTPEGLMVAGWATDLLEAAATLESSIDALRGDAGRNLKIASSLTIAEHLLPRWLTEMRAAEHGTPRQTTISLTATNSQGVIDLVRAGTHSLGFIETPDVPKDLLSRTVASDELVVVVGVSHPWARRRNGITAAELAATPLMVREAGSGTRRALDRALSELPEALPMARPVAELPTTSSILSTVVSGSVPAVVSILAAREGIAAGRLIRVPVSHLRVVRPLTAVWLRSNAQFSGAAHDLLRIATA